jgi:hypothetical protein
MKEVIHMFYPILIIFVIDVILFLYSFYLSLKLGVKVGKKIEIDLSSIKEKINSQKTLILKIWQWIKASIIGLFILVLVLSFSSVFIWLPIVILYKNGVFWGF